MPGSHSHAGKYPALSKRSAICRVPEREELADDLRLTCESEVQVWEQTFLVQRILCRYSRTEQRTDSGVYPESTTGRRDGRPDQHEGVYRPVYGCQEQVRHDKRPL